MLSIEKQMLSLLSRTNHMEIQELIRIYEKRGYSATYIRNALSRLKKEGYVVSPSRSLYEATESGRSFIRSINRKPQRYDEKWDGQWHIVMLEVPEEERRKRDQFRSLMLELGFGLLYHSVYISPWDTLEDVLECVRALGLEGNCTYVQGEIRHGVILPEKARNVWQLEKVGALYQEKRGWFEAEFLQAMRSVFESGKDALELFLLYLELGEAISDLYLADPMLPEELLPSDWTAPGLLEDMFGTYRTIEQAIPADSAYARFTNR